MRDGNSGSSHASSENCGLTDGRIDLNMHKSKSWVRGAALAGLLLSAGEAIALNATITATFTPTLSDPTLNVFTNTTAPGILCRYTPQACGNRKSLIPYWVLETLNPLVANDPNPRQGLTLKAPTAWQVIPVQHVTTGETRVVEMRVVAMAGLFRPSPSADTITGISDPAAAHNALWVGGGLGNAPAPCVGTYSDPYDHYSAWFVWDTPVSADCAKRSAYSMTGARITNSEVLYEIRTPTPLDMSAGTWEGFHSYSIGPGGDFDFGDNFQDTLNATSFDITFRLSVAHHLQIRFPPGADRLALEPEGGWVQWITRGRRPERIWRDQPFRFTSSGPVKMRVECQHLMGSHCAIVNSNKHSVPVQTRISLPVGMHLLTGGPVTRQLLSATDDLSTTNALYVADQAGNLHFEVERSDVDAMLLHPDTTYSGNVTVVWDSYLIP